jgi:hypothetical protein
MAIKETLAKALRDESKSWTRYLIFAENKTGIDRLYIFTSESFSELCLGYDPRCSRYANFLFIYSIVFFS